MREFIRSLNAGINRGGGTADKWKSIEAGSPWIFLVAVVLLGFAIYVHRAMPFVMVLGGVSGIGLGMMYIIELTDFWKRLMLPLAIITVTTIALTAAVAIEQPLSGIFANGFSGVCGALGGMAGLLKYLRHQYR
jgi:hypothetical protein